jgi:hypothetical protein
MSTVVEPEAERFQILPSGARIVRLGLGEDGWLREYQKILRISAQDFLSRAHQAGTPDGVLDALDAALGRRDQAVWLVLQGDYRLLGFALAEVRQDFDAPPHVFVIAAYLYPRRTPRSVLVALVDAIRAWGGARGATAIDFQTRRPRKAWGRVGARPLATLYTVPIAVKGD